MNNSSVLFEQAQKIIPGGVNSPVRAFKNVGGNPIFIASAHGAYLRDVDNKEYIDYVGSWGPMILGHNHSVIRNAVIAAVKNGLSFGAPTKDEVTLAQIINHLMPSIEQVRMVNSGTEATMSAIRLARGYTGRDKIIKFAGCYHGHADSLLVQAGSGALTFGQPSSPGVPDDFAKHTLVCRYNDLDSVTAMLAKYPNEIAAIIVEPVAGNMNCVPPQPGFLDGLRSLCDQNKSLLIFDEVMTGFRVALGGAQSLYNIKPDLTTLGKIIGGGMPVGAFGGKAKIMEQLAPLGPIYQAGTLSGNPIAMAAGIACLKELAKEGNAKTLSQNMQKLVAGMQESAKRHNIDLVVNHVGAMFGFLFNPLKQVTCYEDVAKSNTELFNQFFHLMLKQGIYLAPSTFEAGFISLAHSELEINATIKACDNAFKEMAAIDKQP